MIIAVLDTNVLASGFAGFSQPTSTPGQLLHLWRGGSFMLVVSEVILTELGNTFAIPYFQRRISRQQRTAALTLLRTDALIAPITVEIHGVATHPEDDRILATAVSAQVQYLVTGDRKLQALGSYQNITILSPGAFLQLLQAQQ